MSAPVSARAVDGVGLLLALLCAACSPTAPQSPSATPAPVATFTAQAAADAIEPLDGIIRPRRAPSLSFNTGGKIAALEIAVGDTVRAGQVLARLDHAQARATTAQAEGEQTAAEAAARQAEDVARRGLGLDALGALSASEVNDRRLAALGARGRAQAAAAQVQRAHAALSDEVLVAPEDGVVTAIVAERGTTVGAGATVLRLAAGGREVEIQAPERLALHTGDSALVSLWGRPGQIAARVRMIEPEASGPTRLRKARLTLASNSDESPIDSSVIVRLPRPRQPSAQRVPLTAVRMVAGRAEVWRLSPDRLHVIPSPVKILELRGVDAIVSGVAPGQELVVGGLEGLRPGQPVSVVQTQTGLR